MPRNKKGKSKGKKNGGKTSIRERKISFADLIENLERKSLKIDEKFSAATSEIHRLNMENNYLEQLTLQTRKEREGFLFRSKEYVDSIHAAIEEFNGTEVEQVEEIERNKEILLTGLNNTYRKLRSIFQEKELQYGTVKMANDHMIGYWETEQKQKETIEEMTSSLEAMKKKHESETRDFVCGLIRDRKSWNRLIRLDRVAMRKEMAKKTKPIMDGELKKIHEGSPGLLAQLLMVLKNRESMEGERDKLVKLMISLDLEEQYWSDMKAFQYKRPLVKVANTPSESNRLFRSHQDKSKNGKSAFPKTRKTEPSRKSKVLLTSAGRGHLAYSSLLLMDSSLIWSGGQESTSCRENSHRV